jgi:hypothetical protein
LLGSNLTGITRGGVLTRWANRPTFLGNLSQVPSPGSMLEGLPGA